MISKIPKARRVGALNTILFLALLSILSPMLAGEEAAPAPPEGTLKIAAPGQAISLLSPLALSLSAANPELRLTLETLDENAARKKFDSAETDIIVLSKSQAEPGKEAARLLGTSAAILAVSTQNPVRGITGQELRDILSGKINNWRQLGGKDREIRLCMLTEDRQRLAILNPYLPKDLSSLPNCTQLSKAASFPNLILADEGVLGIMPNTGPFQYARLLEFEKVAPDAEKVAGGSYKLTQHFYLLYKLPVSDAAQKFVDWLCKSEDAKQALAAENLILPTTKSETGK